MEMPLPPAVTVQPVSRVRGEVRPPGDKSISHRYALLSAVADGVSTIRGYSTGADCWSTVSCLRALGVSIDQTGASTEGVTLRVSGRGLGGLLPSAATLDAGNSGSTMRMLAGLLAAHPFTTAITGDSSLRQRPMRRIVVPLERMGARIASADHGRPPLTIQGTAAPTPIDFVPEVPSAQVKSAILLAALHADGVTRISETTPTRDHTERALASFGVVVSREGGALCLSGGQPLAPCRLDVPGDLSSAAFWMVAAAGLPGSEVVIRHVGINPTRTGIIAVLRRMGACIEVGSDEGIAGEPLGSIVVRHGGLGSTEVSPAEVPGIIDELPVLAALATYGGELHVTGAAELRVKESDRIGALAEGLRRMGADIDEFGDGFHVRGRARLQGGEVDARGDHRLVMAFAVAALGASGPTKIHDAGAAAVSYPEFFAVLESLRA
jgi:3-phosphoshikimate 1-carboxyvinyltransferase